MTATDEIYYDPYDYAIDADPHPMWRRMRDERPLYYNERFDFFAVSRYADVHRMSVDWRNCSSHFGSVLEMIKAGPEVLEQVRNMLFEDPPMQDVALHDPKVPKGSTMALLTGSAGHDDRHYPDADRYDVRRKLHGHVSFGYSVHFCLGSARARLEGRVGLEELLGRFPTWEVDEAAAEMVHTSTARGWAHLPATA